jgi:prepilin signal peptidase PulO-like enzyme (type II secretory pathway)
VLLGWEKALLALIIAYFIGSIIGIYLMLRGKANRKSTIAFGPFLVIGTTIVIFFGDFLLNYYLSFVSV